ncbi:cell wall hydrolase [Priestia aryabhattai]|uniref:cell wall hydrolase n=1 Tax=Priestia aryabhattai TaxID=412384 RepID=UPI0039A3B305
MSGIAKSNGMTLSQLIAKNPQVSNPNVISIGQNINTDSTTTQTTTAKGAMSVSAEDKALMARLVQAEASGEPYAGKVAVATVILNRVQSPDFPNTVREVIYQSGQFTPVSNGEINKPADADSIRAVNDAITYQPNSKGALFFYNPKTATNQWNATREVVVTIGNHVFSK